MSPTEHDLRAALRDGEGEGPDPDRLIAVGRARQAQRRMQLITTAVVVLVVGGASTGLVALARGGGGDGTKADSAASGVSRFDAKVPEGAAGGASVSPSADAAGGSRNDRAAAAPSAASCPATLPGAALSGGSGRAQLGAGGPLFDKPVATIVVCAYAAAPGSGARPAQVTFDGSRATRLAASLNDAPKAAPPSPCPRDGLVGVTRELAFIGLAADGTRIGTITSTYPRSGCFAQVTNGTAVRYNWTPPSDLAPILATLAPTPGKVHGSPISS